MFNKIFILIVLTAFSLAFADTAPASRTPLEQSLGLTDPLFKNCVFQPQTRIAHFPVYNFPPTGNYDANLRERVSKSQFQLLHTILTYHPDVAVFDENITTNTFGPNMLQSLQQGLEEFHYTRADGKSFSLQERYSTARSLFHSGIPQYYEHLDETQKEYLFQTGGSMTLYFLGYIRQLHKVIDLNDFQIVLDHINQSGGIRKMTFSNQKDYYIFDFRQEKLKLQVVEFFNLNPSFRGISLIAYGASHDLRDDFSGYLFEDGRHCLQWDE